MSFCFLVVRRQDFIESVNNLNKSDSNYAEYKTKIKRLIDTSEIGTLTRELVWKPNIIFSMINEHSYNFAYHYGEEKPIPFLGIMELNKDNNLKIRDIFYQSLIHFGKCTLGLRNSSANKKNGNININIKNSDNDKIGETFLRDYGIVRSSSFFGVFLPNNITFEGVEQHRKLKYKFVINVLNCPYFDGLNQSYIDENSGINGFVIGAINSWPQVLDSLVRHPLKNDKVIIGAIKGKGYEKRKLSLLNALLKSKNCSTQGLKGLLFDIYLKNDAIEIQQSELKQAYLLCKNEIKNDEWCKLIVDYGKRTNLSVE